MDRRVVFSALALVLVVVGYLLWPRREPITISAHNNESVAQNNTNTAPQDQMKVFSTADLPDRDPHFAFTVSIPVSWVAEYRSDTKSLNFFTAGQGMPSDTLASSQALVQYYQSTDFSAEPANAGDAPQHLTLNGYQAEIYTSTGQAAGILPSWMGESHTVYVIRDKASGQATFLVWSKSPSLNSDQFVSIIKTISFTSN